MLNDEILKEFTSSEAVAAINDKNRVCRNTSCDDCDYKRYCASCTAGLIELVRIFRERQKTKDASNYEENI